jgi:hypothetical protein
LLLDRLLPTADDLFVQSSRLSERRVTAVIVCRRTHGAVAVRAHGCVTSRVEREHAHAIAGTAIAVSKAT